MGKSIRGKETKGLHVRKSAPPRNFLLCHRDWWLPWSLFWAGNSTPCPPLPQCGLGARVVTESVGLAVPTHLFPCQDSHCLGAVPRLGVAGHFPTGIWSSLGKFDGEAQESGGALGRGTLKNVLQENENVHRQGKGRELQAEGTTCACSGGRDPTQKQIDLWWSLSSGPGGLLGVDFIRRFGLSAPCPLAPAGAKA